MMDDYLIYYEDVSGDTGYIETCGETASEAIYEAYKSADISRILSVYVKI